MSIKIKSIHAAMCAVSLDLYYSAATNRIKFRTVILLDYHLQLKCT